MSYEIIPDDMKIVYRDGIKVGDWYVTCDGRLFKVSNSGWKLAVRNDEGLEKVVFDMEKKAVSVIVKNPTLPLPRMVDLSGAVKFFEEFRKDIEKILTGRGVYKSVTPNEDRTVFEVSNDK